jgi:type IV secretory pathway VirB2 component (pilin)
MTKLLAYFSLLTFGYYSVSVHAQASLSDIQILRYNDIFDLILNGIIPFLVALATPLAALVIVWGGYQYFFGTFGAKASGIQAIQNGAIGLAIVTGYQIIINVVKSTLEGGTFNVNPIRDLITQIISDGLIPLSAFIAVVVIIIGGYQYMFGGIGVKANGLDTIQKGVLGLVAVLVAWPVVNTIKALLEGTGNSLVINNNAIISFVLNIINNLVIPISSIVTIVFIIYGGYMYITSRGDSGAISKGRAAIQNALIGFIIVLCAFTISQITVYVVQNLRLGA